MLTDSIPFYTSQTNVWHVQSYISSYSPCRIPNVYLVEVKLYFIPVSLWFLLQESQDIPLYPEVSHLQQSEDVQPRFTVS